jgi:hypothetical protein
VKAGDCCTTAPQNRPCIHSSEHREDGKDAMEGRLGEEGALDFRPELGFLGNLTPAPQNVQGLAPQAAFGNAQVHSGLPMGHHVTQPLQAQLDTTVSPLLRRDSFSLRGPP